MLLHVLNVLQGPGKNRYHATLSPDDGDFGVFSSLGPAGSIPPGSQQKKLGEINIRQSVNRNLMESKQTSRGLYRRERPRSAYDLRQKDVPPVEKKKQQFGKDIVDSQSGVCMPMPVDLLIDGFWLLFCIWISSHGGVFSILVVGSQVR